MDYFHPKPNQKHHTIITTSFAWLWEFCFSGIRPMNCHLQEENKSARNMLELNVPSLFFFSFYRGNSTLLASLLSDDVFRFGYIWVFHQCGFSFLLFAFQQLLSRCLAGCCSTGCVLSLAVPKKQDEKKGMRSFSKKWLHADASANIGKGRCAPGSGIGTDSPYIKNDEEQ